MSKSAILFVSILYLIIPLKILGQPRVNYIINVRLIPHSHIAKIYGTITFINLTNDTLNQIWIQLFPNAYKKHSKLSKQLAALGHANIKFHPKTYGAKIDSLTFHINNAQIHLIRRQKRRQILNLNLKNSLKPGDSVKIQFSYYLKLPFNGLRLGYNDSTFQFVNWYPKVAAYDQNGWHYTELTLFAPLYANLGDYLVKITVPKQFAVIATGKLITKSERAWINDLSLNGLKASQYPNPAPDSLKTITFKAQNVNDFAWIANPNFFVLKDSAKSDTQKITTYIFFTDKNILSWLRGLSFAKTVLNYTTKWLGQYPYNKLYFVQGGLDNNFTTAAANLIIISPKIKNSEKLEAYFFHGLVQSYLRNILCINEIDYPIISRGLDAQMLFRFQKAEKLQLLPFQLNNEKLYFLYNLAHNQGFNQKLNLKLNDYSPLGYYANMQVKAALAFEHLRNYLNYMAKSHQSLSYDTLLNTFYTKYRFKSPDLGDLKKIFYTQQDSTLSKWFFKNIVNQNKTIDYKLRLTKKYAKITATHAAATPMPIRLCSTTSDTLLWTRPQRKTRLKNEKFTKAYIDPDFETLDFNRYNNFSHIGLFKHKSSLMPHLAFVFKPYTKLSLSIFPTIYYRFNEGVMPGILLHNFTFPPHKISFALIPMYSYSLKQIFGYAYAKVNFVSKGALPDLKFSLYLDRFLTVIPTVYQVQYFRNLKLSAKIILHNKQHNDFYLKQIKLLYQRSFSPFYVTFYPQNPVPQPPQYRNFYVAELEIVKNSLWRPFRAVLHGEYLQNERIWVNYALVKQTLHYTSIKNGLTIRLFAGQNAFLSGLTPLNDYRCQGNFISRKYQYTLSPKSPLAHQFYYSFGGFAYYSNDYAYPWLISLKLSSTLPFNLLTWLKFYVVGAAAANSLHDFNYFNVQKFYEYGLAAQISFLRVFLPLGGTFRDFNDQIIDKWYFHVRFSINFESNPAALYKFIKL